MKKRFSSELAYLLGIALIALSSALMQRADFGMSMVVAPAYILHLKLSQVFPWYSFGVSEYLLQGALLILMILIVRRFKRGYLFSFVTAVLYGLILDGFVALLRFLPAGPILVRIVYFILGLLICAVGVALVFHTYIAPEVYELLVKEISDRYGLSLGKVKTAYDLISCLCAVILSFTFFGFGNFVGVNIGTLICALLNGFLISRVSVFLEKHFEFADRLPLRPLFEGKRKT
ncbi:MAG: hypothetical protein II713_05755 [Clostridia bacterium]|nr:hypothetical protein [Clostridia bacterium]